VCENNFYASTTNLRRVLLNDQLSERAEAYRMRNMTIDGNDVLAVYAAVGKAAAEARDGAGPMFIECLTYRQAGHKRNDTGKYRPAEEVSVWMARDPIDRLRARLLDDGVVDAAELDRLDAEAADRAAAAEAFALASPEPDTAVAFEDLHA
jgi:pyruvate dehydrogenase E1 component alpha subunit